MPRLAGEPASSPFARTILRPIWTKDGPTLRLLLFEHDWIHTRSSRLLQHNTFQPRVDRRAMEVTRTVLHVDRQPHRAE